MSIYTTGAYLNSNPTWHDEDAPWKTSKILGVLTRAGIQASRIVDVGCGSGRILACLSCSGHFHNNSSFVGYDLSPQAISLAQQHASNNLSFIEGDPFDDLDDNFDLLLCIDVFEHVPDYLGFLEKCQRKATWKIYHIPLEIHASSIVRNTLHHSRRSVGHLHHFNVRTALASLWDTNHVIFTYELTESALALFWQHPSLKRALANIPRYLLSRVSDHLAARMLGGYSLLVLCR